MISKVFIFVSCLVYVNAGGLLAGHSYGPAIPSPSSYSVNTGHSTVQRSQDAFGNYMFGYNVNGHLGDTKSRYETSDGNGNVRGWYTINDIDGRARRVDYVADAYGFRANVATNEPGTKPSVAGDVAINGEHLKAPLVAAGPALAAPIPVLPAPIPAINYGFSHGYSNYGFGGLGAHAMTYGPSFTAGLAHHKYSAPIASYGAY